jgi:hypothetical protein
VNECELNVQIERLNTVSRKQNGLLRAKFKPSKIGENFREMKRKMYQRRELASMKGSPLEFRL